MTTVLVSVLASMEEADIIKEPLGRAFMRSAKRKAGVGGMRCNCCRPKVGARYLGHHGWRGRNDRYKNHRRS